MVCLVTDGTPFYCPRLPTASDGFPQSNMSADGHPYLNRFPRSNTGADGHPYLNGFPRSTTGTDGHLYLFEHAVNNRHPYLNMGSCSQTPVPAGTRI